MNPDRVDILFATREVTAAHLADAETAYRTAIYALAAAIHHLEQARRIADVADRRYTAAL
jgi:hypothetical protein